MDSQEQSSFKEEKFLDMHQHGLTRAKNFETRKILGQAPNWTLKNKVLKIKENSWTSTKHGLSRTKHFTTRKILGQALNMDSQEQNILKQGKFLDKHQTCTLKNKTL